MAKKELKRKSSSVIEAMTWEQIKAEHKAVLEGQGIDSAKFRRYRKQVHAQYNKQLKVMRLLGQEQQTLYYTPLWQYI